MDTRYEINNKILFFDEFPYRTATSIENIKYILEKNPKLDFEIILIKNNRKNLQSDLSNENEAIKTAIREYNLEGFRVKVVDFEENYNFLFWSFEGFTKNINSFTNDLEELKKILDIFFEIEYEMEYIQIEEKLSEQLLDSFVKYKKSFINKDNIMNLLKINVSDYFFKKDYNYKQFFEFSENLYLKNIDKVCVWNVERDLKNLKLKFKKRIEEFIELPILIKFDGITEEDYIFFYNKYKKEMIEFKNRIKTFFKTELCQLIKDYIKNKIERMENFLDEKIY